MLERLVAMLALCRVLNEACSQAGVIAWPCAVALWSIALVMQRAGSARVIGALGLVCAVAPAAALLAGRLPMSLHGFGAFIIVQAAWSLAVSMPLVLGRV